MHIVGHHLQTEAVARSQSDERDLFARSAYNRYYYASFLAARSALGQMSPDWRRLAHKTYPEVLRGQVLREFKRERTKANKSADYELERQLRVAVEATNALATLLEKAYATRVAADYGTDPVSFGQSARFSLNSVDITEAHSWSAQVSGYAGVVLGAWKQFNV